ncbi:P-loop NTPase [Desulfurispira natronophila]|uniref:Flagellar biosynthesis protein FlhG n=1 Tax=Desulfurispira natronophila TaxID=682562 RepID=A0A7W7Y593_9BACT|nr:P-loop NTPase [Desulfurispira natronophila]MBB5022032.1 flagellar biosynthesis protein FlhG [Desulfurispira natronophila]
MKQKKHNSTKILAIGGGKGGVGKTLIASNIAILLGKYGKNTIVIDADFGCSNLHTCMGMGKPDRSLADFVNKRIPRLDEIPVPTPYENLRLISAHVDIAPLVNMHHGTKTRFINSVKRLVADYVIMDLGAGSTQDRTDMFLMADWGVVVVTPEPTSVENVYSFLKNCIFRMVLRTFKGNDIIKDILKNYAENPQQTFKTRQLVDEIEAFNPEMAQEFREVLKTVRPLIIMNMVREDGDRRVGQGLEDIIRKYLLLDAKFIGYLPYDTAVVQHMREARPVAAADESATSVKSLKNIVGQINFINKNTKNQ